MSDDRRTQESLAGRPEAGRDPQQLQDSLELPVNSSVHTIRLGAPWEVAAEGESTRYTRHFGKPRILDSCDRVWLICQTTASPGELVVNGLAVGQVSEGTRFAADITAFLLPRNVLSIVVGSCGSIGEMVLEIRSCS